MTDSRYQLTMPHYDGADVTIIILAIPQQILDSARQNGELTANVKRHAEYERVRRRIAAHYQRQGNRLIGAKAQVGGLVSDLEERISLVR